MSMLLPVDTEESKEFEVWSVSDTKFLNSGVKQVSYNNFVTVAQIEGSTMSEAKQGEEKFVL